MDMVAQTFAGEASADPINQVPIGFKLITQGPFAPNVAVIYDVAEWNSATLQIRNNSGTDLILDRSSLIRVDVFPFALPRLYIRTAGWLLLSQPHLVLQPSERQVFARDAILEIAIGGMIEMRPGGMPDMGPPTAGHFIFQCGGSGWPPANAVSVPVLRMRPPSQSPEIPFTWDVKDRPGDPITDGEGRAIHVTPWPITPQAPPVFNQFDLEIRAGAAVLAGPEMRFLVSFLSGDGDACLARDGEMAQVTARILQAPAATDGHWVLTRDKMTPATVFAVACAAPAGTAFAGGDALVIRFENLVTTLPAGTASRLAVQYTGVPGYNDGCGFVLLDKVGPPPSILVGADKVAPAPEIRVAPNTRLKLAWTCSGTGHCEVISSDGSVSLADQPLSGEHDCEVGSADVMYTVRMVGPAVTASSSAIVHVMRAQALKSADETSADPINTLPIGFNLVTSAKDAHGDAVVYMSADPQWGHVTLQMRNNSGADIKLDASSLLRVYVVPLIPAAAVAGISAAAAAGWDAVPAGTGRLTHVELHPTAPLKIPHGATIEIALDGVLATGATVTTSGTFTFDCVGAGWAPSSDVAVIVARLAAPDQQSSFGLLTCDVGSRADYASIDGEGHAIYVTPWPVTPDKPAIYNYFVLEIGANAAITVDAEKTRFVISFPSGDSDSALCRDDEITQMIASVDQSPDDGPWRVDKDPDAAMPVFVARPEPGTTTFNNGALNIRFANLPTTLPSGKSSRVLVHFTGLLPNYNDSSGHVLLDKIDPQPHVRSFTASRADGSAIAPESTIDYGNVKLAWDVFAAEYCLLKELAHAPFAATDSCTFAPTPGQLPNVAFTPPQTPLTLTLQPQVGSQPSNNFFVAFSVNGPTPQASVSADNVASAQTITVGPNAQIKLSWNCSGADHCNVSSSDGKVALTNQPVCDSHSCTVALDDVTYTVTAVGAGAVAATAGATVSPPVVTFGANGYWVATHEGRGEFSRTYYTWNVTVSWDVQYAVSCIVVDDNSHGTLSTEHQGNWSTVPASGAGTQRYRLTATGRGAPVVQTAQVPPPP